VNEKFISFVKKNELIKENESILLSFSVPRKKGRNPNKL